MDQLTVSSPSKINLHLRVGAPTADGFHPLRSWMVATSLCDQITIRRSSGGVSLTCDDPTIPTDGTNLVVRAADAVLGRVKPALRTGLTIDLSKRIPAGAGLGGGSGNAAVTLRAVNRLLGGPLDESTLFSIAATLGSDVPFFLGDPSAIATGRGEQLSAAPIPRANHAVLILPPFPIATAKAYRTLDERRPTAEPDLLDAFDVATWANLSAVPLLTKLKNDLEQAAFAIEPRLDVLRLELESRLGRIVRMSGSGSTLFTLFDSAAEADAAAKQIRSWETTATVVELGGSSRGERP